MYAALRQGTKIPILTCMRRPDTTAIVYRALQTSYLSSFKWVNVCVRLCPVQTICSIVGLIDMHCTCTSVPADYTSALSRALLLRDSHKTMKFLTPICALQRTTLRWNMRIAPSHPPNQSVPVNSVERVTV